MKKITTILSFVFISIILFGCQQSNDKKLDNEVSNTDKLENFLQRLIALISNKNSDKY